MTGSAREIQEAIRILAGLGSFRAARFFVATIKTVNEDDRICDVESTLDDESIVYSDVHLSVERNDGVIQIPAIDSSVIVVAMPDGNKYIIAFSDISKYVCYIDGNNSFEFDSSGFVFNGGTLDGLVKVNSLVTKLNNLENKVNNLITAIGTTWIPVPNDGGAALKLLVGTTLAATTLTPLTPTVKADLENQKIKQ